LKEQTQGGVPKMFLTSHDEYGDCNIPNTSTGNTDSNHSSSATNRHVAPLKETDAAGNEVICID
jgi:hypothetical protein